MLTRSGMVLALQAAGLGLTYGVEVALARLLGPADYGIYRYVVAAIALLATLAGLGLPVLALRLIPVYLHQQRSDLLHGFLRSSTCLVALAALPFGALGVLGFRLFELPAHDLTLLAPSLLVGTLGMAWMNLATETSLALSRPVLGYLPARTLRPLVVLAIALGLAGAHPTNAVVLVASIASFFVAAGVQSALLRRNIRSGGTRSETRLGDWLPVALQLLMPVVLGVSVANLDLLIVGRFVPLEEIGAYGAAQRTASLIGLFLLSANSVAAPLYAALWERQEREALQSLLTTFAHWSTWPALRRRTSRGSRSVVRESAPVSFEP